MTPTLTTIVLPHYTTHEYEQWKDNWEIINGIPFFMTLPTNKHQDIAERLYDLFRDGLRDTDFHVHFPRNYKISDDTILQPDLFVMYGKPQDQLYITEPLSLVVEILSKDRNKDTVIKKALYEEQGITYYMIIDPVRETYSIYSLQSGSYWITANKTKHPFMFKMPDGSYTEVFINFDNIFS